VGLADVERRLRERVRWLEWRDEAVREMLTPQIVDETWPEGSFPHRLLTELLDDPEALEFARDLLEEARR
jgi:hypothetical protein